MRKNDPETLTPGGVATAPTETAGPLALDITYGTRPATRCTLCARPMTAADRPIFELETADGEPLCLVCSGKQHHGLRLVCAVMNHVVEAHGVGDKQSAAETVQGIVSALELLEEDAPKVPYRRPVRRQPNRAARRRRR